MRRLHTLLVAAGLSLAPSTVLGDPPRSPKPQIETFEFSTMASKGRLGVMVMSLTPELRTFFGAPSDRGVLIARVEPGSAAEAAGIAVGDVLVDVKGTQVDDALDVLSTLAGGKQGDAIQLGVIRDKQRMTRTATLTEDAPPRSARPPLSLLDDALPGMDWLRDLLADPHRPDRTTRS